MQHDAPLVSVIMPAFNAVKSLPVAIGSVRDQSIPDIEIIIVDDASTDATATLSAELMKQDKRIRYFRMPCNSGPAAARNVGLGAARGVWVAPVDADDEIDFDRLRALSEVGEAQVADMVADSVSFVGNGRPFVLPATCISGGQNEMLSVEALIRSDIPLNGTFSLGYLKPLMRRAFLQRFGLRYDEGLRFAEDLNLYARALLCGARFVLHAKSYYYYNQTPQSVSRYEDALPELAEFALLCNQKLSEIDDMSPWPGLGPLLTAHRLRWATVLWFNQLKKVLRAEEPNKVWHLLTRCPGGPVNMVSFFMNKMRLRPGHTNSHITTIITSSRNIDCP